MSRTPHDVVFATTMEMPELAGSYRVMSMIPAAEIGARLIYMPPEETPDAFLDRVQPKVLVLGKPIYDDRPTQLCEAAKARGVKTISWHCDAPGADEMTARFLRHAKASDAVVVQTRPMADVVEKLIGYRPDIIEEALEYQPYEPHFEPQRKPLQLLWYGNSINFDALPAMLDSVAKGVGRDLALLILAASKPDTIQHYIARPQKPPLEIAVMPWSRPNQVRMMRSCDVVVIPSRDAYEKHLKGHNRVSEALNQGCVTVAFPLEPYKELAEYVTLSTDIGEGLKRVLADPAAALARTEAGFDAVRARFSPEAVARKWLALIDRVAAG